MLKIANQAGDTIVEVMVVLAILGSAIGICYATANRSLLNARQAQENTEATEIAKTQAEYLRVLAPNGSVTPSIYSTGTNEFCIVDGGGGAYSVAVTNNPSPNASCIKSSLYEIAITQCKANLAAKCAGLTTDDNFIVKVKWPDVMGHVDDTVSIVYRVHAT